MRTKFELIISEASKIFERDVNQLLIPSRKYEDVAIRDIIISVAYHLGYTQREIAVKVNAGDHSTISSSLSRFPNKKRQYEWINRSYQQILESLTDNVEVKHSKIQIQAARIHHFSPWKFVGMKYDDKPTRSR